jgi:hypothetical protein
VISSDDLDTMSCADVLFLAARGSGEVGPGGANQNPGDDDLGVGAPVHTAYEELRSRVVADGRSVVGPVSVVYPADPVSTIWEESPQLYTEHLWQGVAEARETLSDRAMQCPNERLVLAGYSQGAMVMHRVLRNVTTASVTEFLVAGVLQRIDAAILIADGDRVAYDTAVDFGTAGRNAQGLGQLDTTVKREKLPSTVGAKTMTVCDDDDIVCDVRVPAECLLVDTYTCVGRHIERGKRIHTRYEGTQAVKDAAAAAAARVGEAQWPNPPTLVASADTPELAVGANGAVFVSFRNCPNVSPPEEAPRYVCQGYVSRSDDHGLSFGPVVDATLGDTEAPWDHDLFVGPDARVHHVWNSYYQSPFASHSDDNGLSFIGPVSVNDRQTGSGPVNGGTGPAAAQSGDGTIHVVWIGDRVTGGTGLFLATSTDHGLTFAPAVTVVGFPYQGPYPTVQIVYPTIAVGGGGVVYVAWEQVYSAGTSEIRLARSTNGGISFLASTVVNDATTSPVWPIDGLALAASGNNVFVVWGDGRNKANGDYGDIYFARSMDAGVSFGANAKLNHDAGTASQGSPTMAVGPAGQVFVAWYDTRNERGNNGDIYATVSVDNGQTFGVDERVNPELGSAIGSGYASPNGVVDAEGRFYVAWVNRPAPEAPFDIRLLLARRDPEL